MSGNLQILEVGGWFSSHVWWRGVTLSSWSDAFTQFWENTSYPSKYQAHSVRSSISFWLVVWNIFYFSIYWEFHHPNWRTPWFFRRVSSNHQPALICLASFSGWIHQRKPAFFGSGFGEPRPQSQHRSQRSGALSMTWSAWSILRSSEWGYTIWSVNTAAEDHKFSRCLIGTLLVIAKENGHV